VHIKTDSIKIPNATPDIIQFIMDFGTDYGYTFEHEGTYDKFCLVNDAVYIAKEDDHWTAVGAQFQHPYVYKTLFTGEPVAFEDYCEARSVLQGVMYLDFIGTDDQTDYKHVGRTGMFVPVSTGGGRLLRVKDGKAYAVTGTKNHLWVEAAVVNETPGLEIDYAYFDNLANKAREAIENFGSFEAFAN